MEVANERTWNAKFYSIYNGPFCSNVDIFYRRAAVKSFVCKLRYYDKVRPCDEDLCLNTWLSSYDETRRNLFSRVQKYIKKTISRVQKIYKNNIIMCAKKYIKSLFFFLCSYVRLFLRVPLTLHVHTGYEMLLS